MASGHNQPDVISLFRVREPPGIVVDSLVFRGGIHTHTFEDTRDLFDEVFGERIYAGFHYRHSLEDGGRLGRQVSKQLFRTHFRPQDREDDGKP